MEWAVFAGIVFVYGLKGAMVWISVCRKPQPRGPFRRPGLTGRFYGETSINDFSEEGRQQIFQNLQRTQRRKKCHIPEKVNWKVEGF